MLWEALMSESENLFYRLKYRFIRWNYWVAQYDVAIYEAILLSLDFDPARIYYPERRWATELKSSDRIVLDERVEIIKTHIGKGKTFDCEDGFLSCRLNLKEFSVFLKKVHLTMPAVLESYANNDSNLQDVINQYVTAFQQQSHDTGTPAVGHAPPEHYQKQRDQLLKENEQLKAEVAQAQECIKQLESNQQNTPLNNLLGLILDESAIERYAPDLVYAIKLWQSIYVDNTKPDSHNNKANLWIKNNTPYNGEQENNSTRRLREIATPYNDWHQRRKGTNKQDE